MDKWELEYCDTSSDLTDSQWHDIGECYLTNSQYEDLFSDWSKPENDCIQSNMEMDCSESDVHNDCIQSDMKMDCSGSDKFDTKRKSSDSECSRPNKVRVIESNQQFGVGRLKPEKEKNLHQEIRQSHQPERVNQH